MRAFVPNPRFESEMKQTVGHRKAMVVAAGEIASVGRAIAPRRTGFYSRRFKVGEENGEVAVGNADPFAHIIEFGSVNSPVFAPIRRAVRAAGLRLDETPR